MKPRIKSITEKVISVKPNGESIVYPQKPIPFYHNPELVDAKRNINRPLGTWLTPKSLENKVAYTKQIKADSIQQGFQVIRELKEFLNVFSEKTKDLVDKRPRLYTKINIA